MFGRIVCFALDIMSSRRRRGTAAWHTITLHDIRGYPDADRRRKDISAYTSAAASSTAAVCRTGRRRMDASTEAGHGHVSSSTFVRDYTEQICPLPHVPSALSNRLQIDSTFALDIVTLPSRCCGCGCGWFNVQCLLPNYSVVGTQQRSGRAGRTCMTKCKSLMTEVGRTGVLESKMCGDCGNGGYGIFCPLFWGVGVVDFDTE